MWMLQAEGNQHEADLVDGEITQKYFKCAEPSHPRPTALLPLHAVARAPLSVAHHTGSRCALL